MNLGLSVNILMIDFSWISRRKETKRSTYISRDHNYNSKMIICSLDNKRMLNSQKLKTHTFMTTKLMKKTGTLLQSILDRIQCTIFTIVRSIRLWRCWETSVVCTAPFFLSASFSSLSSPTASSSQPFLSNSIKSRISNKTPLIFHQNPKT